MRLPTLEEFLNNAARNSYIKHPEFSSLYVHKGEVGAIIGGECYRCTNCVTLANIVATKPGSGAFTRLLGHLGHLVNLGYAVKVECVHEERFQNKLLSMGFTLLEGGLPPSYITNERKHLHLWDEEPRTFRDIRDPHAGRSPLDCRRQPDSRR